MQQHGNQQSWQGRCRLQAHRSASVDAPSTTGEGDFNALVAPESVDASVGEELRRGCTV
jgi:hypothetical protein